MSDRSDAEDKPKAPSNDAASEEQSRDSIENVSRVEASTRDNLSNEVFGQGSSSFKQSAELMGQSLKKGSELAMAQFGHLTLFDSQVEKQNAAKDSAKTGNTDAGKDSSKAGNSDAGKGSSKAGNSDAVKDSTKTGNSDAVKDSAKTGNSDVVKDSSKSGNSDAAKDQATKSGNSNDAVNSKAASGANENSNSKSTEKSEKKDDDLADDEKFFNDLADPVKQAQRKKETAEKEAKAQKEFDEKAATRTAPKDGEPLDTNSSKEGIKDYLKKLPDIDYKNVLQGHQVTLLGEHHLDSAAKEHVADYAKNMKDAGATHFGAEVIPQNMQPTLDKFMKGDKEARKEIEKHIMDTWDKSYPGTGAQYMKMLDAVNASGMKIVGMDVNGHIDKGEEGRHERDKAWSDSIANVLKNDPNAKIVAFGGAGHFERNTAWTKSTNELLKADHNIDAQVLRLSGLPASPPTKHDEALRENERNPQYRLSLYSQEAGQASRSVLVPLAPKADSQYDGYILLPRKQK